MRLAARIWVLVAVTAVVCCLALPAAAAPLRPADHIAYDISANLKNMVPPAQKADAAQLAALDVPADILAEHGDPDLVLELYDTSATEHAGPHSVPFWKERSGLHSDVYVAWADLAAPPTSSQQAHTITSAQLDYMRDEFDGRIWESDVFHFGNYEPRPDAPGGERAAIMIYNIRDDAYWSSYRYYTAGYFWASLNDDIQMNAIFIDSFDWANRTGATAARPYLYEGTIAHEFQHLIHSDVDGDEDSFVDEGLADMAEQFLYGTITTGSHIGEYLFYHRDSLIDWDGELYDYGNAVLWQDYLYERLGGGVLQGHPSTRVTPEYAGNKFADTDDKFTDPGDAYIWNLIHDQANGLESIAGLVGGMQALEDYHHDYTLANLLDGVATEAKWNYANLALGGVDSDYYSIADGIPYYHSRYAGNFPPTRKVVRRTNSEPWGANYRTISGLEPGFTPAFTGRVMDGVAAYSAPNEWFGGLGNSLNNTLSRSFSVATGDVLTFRTWFDIEEEWDYGYVEAWDGTQWKQLTQTSLLPAAMSNPNGSSAYDGPGGLTGSSGGWQLASYSLEGLTGDVVIRFRYATDEAVNGLGWYIDDIAVGSQTDAVTDATRGMWTTHGWLYTDGLQQNDWTADVYVPGWRGKLYAVTPVIGTAGIGTFGEGPFIKVPNMPGNSVYVIASNRPNGVARSSGTWATRK